MSTLLSLTPDTWKEYELIDCGHFQKLEKFGACITIRPEPQAVWNPNMTMAEWEKMADVKFIPRTSSSGDWKKLKNTADRWELSYSGKCNLKLRLSLTAFKHVGLFPEQAVNWEYIVDSINRMQHKTPRVLNLFAYTGAASLAARFAGAETYHLDSIKQVVTWARENMELSGLADIRWVVEDALKFVKREVKRGKKFNGIILDPPAYGHGPSGEKWKLEDSINEMMTAVLQLLDEQEHFLILNAYSLGYSPMILENLVRQNFKPEHVESGELFLNDRFDKKLPLGSFVRFRRLS